MRLFDYLLEQPVVFNLSQLPFTTQKFSRILMHNDISEARHVLDVGCGPGSNTIHFKGSRYLGIDINERYIRMARGRYNREFMVTDVTTCQSIPQGSYDFILLNSFLHHIDTPSARRVLSRLTDFLTSDGHVHSIELVLPERSGFPRWLALCDRGKFPRDISSWRDLFESTMETVVFEPFAIRFMRADVMELVYFKGRAKR